MSSKCLQSLLKQCNFWKRQHTLLTGTEVLILTKLSNLSRSLNASVLCVTKERISLGPYRPILLNKGLPRVYLHFDSTLFLLGLFCIVFSWKRTSSSILLLMLKPVGNMQKIFSTTLQYICRFSIFSDSSGFSSTDLTYVLKHSFRIPPEQGEDFPCLTLPSSSVKDRARDRIKSWIKPFGVDFNSNKAIGGSFGHLSVFPPCSHLSRLFILTCKHNMHEAEQSASDFSSASAAWNCWWKRLSQLFSNQLIFSSFL